LCAELEHFFPFFKKTVKNNIFRKSNIALIVIQQIAGNVSSSGFTYIFIVGLIARLSL